MRNAYWTLESLPPRLRLQAERQLGIATPSPQSGDEIAKHTSGSEGVQQAQRVGRMRGGMLCANKGVPKTDPQSMRRTGAHELDKPQKVRRTLTPDMAKNLVRSQEVSPDGSEVRFVLDIDSYMLPTAQQKGAFVGKDGKVHFFTKAKVAKSEKTLIKALSPYAARFDEWGDAVRALSIDFCFPFPATTAKKNLVDFTYHVNRPDVDNLAKSLLDSLTQSGFWADDSLIAELHLRKFRTITKPRIILTVKKLKSALNSCETDLFGEEETFFSPSERSVVNVPEEGQG